MKKYEIMFIVRPTLGEDEVKKVIKDFGKTLTTKDIVRHLITKKED